MRKERKHYTAEEKVGILRRHLLDKVPVSDLCEELGLQPTVFYRWQKEFFENGAAAFQSKSRPDHQAGQQRIEFLEKRSEEHTSELQSLAYLVCRLLLEKKKNINKQSVSTKTSLTALHEHHVSTRNP